MVAMERESMHAVAHAEYHFCAALDAAVRWCMPEVQFLEPQVLSLDVQPERMISVVPKKGLLS
jgi:hypothetical protein